MEVSLKTLVVPKSDEINDFLETNFLYHNRRKLLLFPEKIFPIFWADFCFKFLGGSKSMGAGS